jgi:hypothetical protein
MTARGETPTARRARKSRAADIASIKKVLDRLTADELASVLRRLLERHPDLDAEAFAIATEIVSSPSVDEIAEQIFEAVTSLGIEAFHGRTGKRPWGYIEPGEAAWTLLEESVHGVLADMKRRLDMGLEPAAEAICCGIVVGLHEAEGAKSDGPLGWAPDFPAEEACYAVVELVRSCPPGSRVAVHDRLIKTLADLVPDWRDMLSRAAREALKSNRA